MVISRAMSGEAVAERETLPSTLEEKEAYAGCHVPPSLGGGNVSLELATNTDVNHQAYDDPNCFSGPRPPALLSSMMSAPPKTDLDVWMKAGPFLGPLVGGGIGWAWRAWEAAQVAKRANIVGGVHAVMRGAWDAYVEVYRYNKEIALTLAPILGRFSQDVLGIVAGQRDRYLSANYHELSGAIEVLQKEHRHVEHSLDYIRRMAYNLYGLANELLRR